MNGFIQSARAACLTAGVLALIGCHGYRDVVDPCYPQRYNFIAHNIVCGTRKAQVNNGHILDQTVWNWHFDRSKATLNEAGVDHLRYLVRRRPSPDSVIYLATASASLSGDADLRYDPANPDRLAEQRTELDNRRIEAIQRFLNAHAPGRDVNFQVLVHDPAETGAPAGQSQLSVTQWNAGAQGSMGSGGGGGAVGGGS